MDLGKAILQLRKERGYTQAKLSELSGISQTCISQIETNAKFPEQKTIKIIANVLFIQIGEIYIRALEPFEISKYTKTTLIKKWIDEL